MKCDISVLVKACEFTESNLPVCTKLISDCPAHNSHSTCLCFDTPFACCLAVILSSSHFNTNGLTVPSYY